MGWDGMLAKPGVLRCKKCDKPLNEDGNYPAESYAGTYTGLCYGCERKGVVQVAVSSIDGAICMEYPPHCPSWRRDRERYWGYSNCPDCGGACSEWVSRSDAMGGSYRKYCKTCLDRLREHPTRIWMTERVSNIRLAAERIFKKEKTKYLRRNKMKARDDIPDKDLEKLRAPIIAKYEKAMEKWNQLRSKRVPVIER